MVRSNCRHYWGVLSGARSINHCCAGSASQFLSADGLRFMASHSHQEGWRTIPGKISGLGLFALGWDWMVLALFAFMGAIAAETEPLRKVALLVR